MVAKISAIIFLELVGKFFFNLKYFKYLLSFEPPKERSKGAMLLLIALQARHAGSASCASGVTRDARPVRPLFSNFINLQTAPRKQIPNAFCLLPLAYCLKNYFFFLERISPHKSRALSKTLGSLVRIFWSLIIFERYCVHFS